MTMVVTTMSSLTPVFIFALSTDELKAIILSCYAFVASMHLMGEYFLCYLLILVKKAMCWN